MPALSSICLFIQYSTNPTMSIYTRRGDNGTTRIYGTRESKRKDEPRIASLGGLDELNAQLGVVLVLCRDGRAKRELARIQRILFEIGAELGTSTRQTGSNMPPPFRLRKSAAARLERWIDFYWKNLPPLANFIFPGGSETGAQVHVARTVARRAEREIVKLSQTERVNPNILSYINRLSDYLLAAARWVNHQEGVGDVIWISHSASFDKTQGKSLTANKKRK